MQPKFRILEKGTLQRPEQNAPFFSRNLPRIKVVLNRLLVEETSLLVPAAIAENTAKLARRAKKAIAIPFEVSKHRRAADTLTAQGDFNGAVREWAAAIALVKPDEKQVRKIHMEAAKRLEFEGRLSVQQGKLSRAGRAYTAALNFVDGCSIEYALKLYDNAMDTSIAAGIFDNTDMLLYEKAKLMGPAGATEFRKMADRLQQERPKYLAAGDFYTVAEILECEANIWMRMDTVKASRLYEKMELAKRLENDKWSIIRRLNVTLSKLSTDALAADKRKQMIENVTYGRFKEAAELLAQAAESLKDSRLNKDDLLAKVCRCKLAGIKKMELLPEQPKQQTMLPTALAATA
ncbi:MAG: hypothetical protein V1492_01390 [Candidatus Micrarchaeota archaeon]